MVHINVDGKRYSFDNYDDMEVCKQILEDIWYSMRADFRGGELKTIRVINSMRIALEGKRNSHI